MKRLLFIFIFLTCAMCFAQVGGQAVPGELREVRSPVKTTPGVITSGLTVELYHENYVNLGAGQAATLFDTSGYGNHCSQTVDVSKPTPSAGGLQFTGNTFLSSVTNLNPVLASGANTVMILCDPTPSAGNAMTINFKNASTHSYSEYHNGTNWVTYTGAGSLPNIAMARAGVKMIVAKLGGPASKAINSSSSSSASCGPTVAKTLIIGYDAVVGVGGNGMKILAILAYSRQLTADEITYNKNILLARYGVTLSP